MSERIERLKHLLSKYPEPWVIEKEPHPYSDGTKEFTHVRYKAKHLGHEVIVSIGDYVTPDLAELLVLLRECAIEFTTPPAVAVPEWHEDVIDMPTLRAMAKLMESESDEPGDIRGLRARAVNGALDEIERLRSALQEIADEKGDHRGWAMRRKAIATLAYQQQAGIAASPPPQNKGETG